MLIVFLFIFVVCACILRKAAFDHWLLDVNLLGMHTIIFYFAVSFAWLLPNLKNHVMYILSVLAHLLNCLHYGLSPCAFSPPGLYLDRYVTNCAPFYGWYVTKCVRWLSSAYSADRAVQFGLHHGYTAQ